MYGVVHAPTAYRKQNYYTFVRTRTMPYCTLFLVGHCMDRPVRTVFVCGYFAPRRLSAARPHTIQTRRDSPRNIWQTQGRERGGKGRKAGRCKWRAVEAQDGPGRGAPHEDCAPGHGVMCPLLNSVYLLHALFSLPYTGNDKQRRVSRRRPAGGGRKRARRNPSVVTIKAKSICIREPCPGHTDLTGQFCLSPPSPASRHFHLPSFFHACRRVYQGHCSTSATAAAAGVAT